MKHTKNEDGFVLVSAMLTLVVLTIVGISAMNNTNLEKLIASNERRYKETFYAAEAGLDLGGLMVEENVSCPGGFTATTIGSITIQNLTFWSITPADLSDSTLATIDLAVDSAFSFPMSYTNTTNVVIAGTTKFAHGSSLQMIAGYEGKGKGAGGGGALISYDIVTQANGMNNSQSEVQIVWGHKIGQEGTCNYQHSPS